MTRLKCRVYQTEGGVRVVFMQPGLVNAYEFDSESAIDLAQAIAEAVIGPIKRAPDDGADETDGN